MTHRPDEPLDPKVSCEVCRREIPKSEARSAEGKDYVLYFCGLDCYEAWRAKDETDNSRR